MITLRKQNIRIILVFLSFLFFTSFLMISAKAIDDTVNTNNILVKPAFLDLGSMGNEPQSFTATVSNNYESTTFTANVEGKGKEFISFDPESFTLEKGESKQVKVQINNSDKLGVGPYDFSIIFTTGNNTTGWVSTKTSNSLRLKFIKEGIALASLNVTDIHKPERSTFHVIFGNFTITNKVLNTTVTILSKEDNRVVANFNENITMNPYPSDGFYGTMKIAWDTKAASMGDYILEYNSIDSDGIVLQGNKDFMVGEFKGKLLKTEVKDTFKGTPVKLLTQVNNIGNLKLPTTFSIIIKNNLGEKVFEDKKQVTIPVGSEDTIVIEWPTDETALGKYTVEYSVEMGNDIVSDTLDFKILSPYTRYIVATIVFILVLIIFIVFKRRTNKKRIKL